MPRFKKGSAAAKRYMASIRTRKTKSAPRRVGATKFIERGETAKTPAKKIVRVNRSKAGRFKSVTRVGQVDSIGKVKSIGQDILKDKLGNLMVKQYTAKTKREKKKIGKQITEVKRDLRRFM